MLYSYLNTQLAEHLRQATFVQRAQEAVGRYLSDPTKFTPPAPSAVPSLPFILPPYLYEGGFPAPSAQAYAHKHSLAVPYTQTDHTSVVEPAPPPYNPPAYEAHTPGPAAKDLPRADNPTYTPYQRPIRPVGQSATRSTAYVEQNPTYLQKELLILRSAGLATELLGTVELGTKAQYVRQRFLQRLQLRYIGTNHPLHPFFDTVITKSGVVTPYAGALQIR